MLAVQVCCARHCELPLSKMGNQGLFPGRVSEANQGRGQPRRGYRRPKPATHSGAGRKSRRAACFLWYFLSLRKKVLPPVGAAAPPSAPESARQTLIGKRRLAPAGAPKGFPRGKQSARFALPCAPLVVCLNDRSLTAFGGCIHWIPASLRSPLEAFDPRRWARFPLGTASLTPAP